MYLSLHFPLIFVEEIGEEGRGNCVRGFINDRMTSRKEWEDRKVKRYHRFSFPPNMFGWKNRKIKE